MVGANRLGNILDLLLADELEGERELALDLVKRGAGDADAAGFGQRLKPGSDVDAVAVDGAVFLLDHIAQVDADAKLHAPVFGELRVAPGELVLDLVGAVHGFDGAGKLCENTIACGVDEPSAVDFDAFAEQVAGLIESAKGGGLVVGHQPRVAGCVSGEDGREFALIVHRSGSCSGAESRAAQAFTFAQGKHIRNHVSPVSRKPSWNCRRVSSATL